MEEKYPKLDKSIKDPKERNKIVHQIVNTYPPETFTPYYLQQLTKYLTQTIDTKKDKIILTTNRMITINKRETSYEGLVAKLECGEDSIYHFSSQGDKSVLLVPKIEITKEDEETIPGLKELRQQIKKIEKLQKNAAGRKKFLLTKQLIEMRQDQYVLKYTFKPPITSMRLTKSVNQIDLTEHIRIDQNGQPVSDCIISLFDPHTISCLLCNYSKLKEQAWGHFEQDWYYLMESLDGLIDLALKDKHPILFKILIYKIDGLQNKQISEKIKEQFDIKYTAEYLSNAWRQKIPKIIAAAAKQQWIQYHYLNEARGQWKRCSCCGKIKLAHPYYFNRNATSKDGLYSICKQCRNQKYRRQEKPVKIIRKSLVKT